MRTALLAARLVASCAPLLVAALPAGAGESATHRLDASTAAAIAALMPALDSAGEGRRLFLKLNCYGCHGMFAGGAIGPNIVGETLDVVEFNVLNGNDGGMPSFAQYVDATDIQNITDYLDSIGTPDEPKFMDWWKKNPKK